MSKSESLFSATYDTGYFADGALAATAAVANAGVPRVAEPESAAEAAAHDAAKAAVGHALNLRLFADRNDWLMCEQSTALSLLGVRWAGALLGESAPDFSSSTLDYPASAQRAVAAAAEMAGRVQRRFPSLDYAFAKPIGQFMAQPELVSLMPRVTNEQRRSARSRLVAALAKLPEYLGVAAFGSTANAQKEDAYSDVDLHCVCAALPSEARRNELDTALGISGTYRNGRAHYLCLDGVYIHLNFIVKDEQQRAFDTRDNEGVEPAITDFGTTVPRAATWSYDWMCAAILDDPRNVVAEIMRRAAAFPRLLGEREVRRWLAQGVQLESGAAAALARNDHLAAFALSGCALEAAARRMLANAGIFSNPVSPKWFCIDMQALGGETSCVRECLRLLEESKNQDVERRLAVAKRIAALA